jgi:hypothetical protein
MRINPGLPYQCFSAGKDRTANVGGKNPASSISQRTGLFPFPGEEKTGCGQIRLHA